MVSTHGCALLTAALAYYRRCRPNTHNYLLNLKMFCMLCGMGKKG